MKNSRSISKSVFIFVQFFLIAFISVSTLAAQTSNVDLSFNPIVSKDKDNNGNAIQQNFTLQPDGKILTYGNFQVINGVIKNSIARLNADGSLDNSFSCTTCDFNIGSAVVQTGGKIIVAGSFYSAATLTSAARLKRLNADGSVDNSFNPVSPFNGAITFPTSYGATVYAVQPDGRILVVLGGSTSGSSFGSLQRLNADGTNDATFSPIEVVSGRNIRTTPTKIFLQPNGKILIASTTTGAGGSSSTLKRYNANGSLDSTFEPPTFVGTGSFGDRTYISDFELLADGNIIIVGNFKSVNAIDRTNVVKIQSAGNVDLSFAPVNNFQANEPANGIGIYSNGKILVSTGIIINPVGQSGTTNRFIRYNANGSLDATFTSPANLVLINKFVINASDSPLIHGSFTENGATVNKFARLNTDGSVASSFIVDYGIGGSVTTAAIQADGKVIIGGNFTHVGGVARNKIARINSDGSVDQTFNPQVSSNNAIVKTVVQSDGKILVAGSFTIANVGNIGLIRLNTDGSLDTTFNPIVSDVRSIVQQSDGKILIGGGFATVNGQSRPALARLNADGTTDASFGAILGGGSVLTSVVLQPDGKILGGGGINGINGFNRGGLVRLNSDGTLDTTFNANGISGLEVALYSNGKYIVYNGDKIVRLNNDGTTDTTFQSPTFNYSVNTILVQPDGTIILGGSFAPDRLMRLKPDGTVDITFLPIGANDTVRMIIRQTDGKIIVGGDFTMIAGVTKLAVARLNIAPVRARTTLFDFDGDGKADLTVFRPSNGFWYELRSQNNAFYALQFGQASDKLAPADYDGDGKTDIAVFRDNVPGAGDKAYFYITNSSDNIFRPVQFGTQNDVPMSGDWDGDGVADIAVYRAAATAGGQGYFFYRPSSAPGVDFRSIPWGTMGDKPVRGDFDGDGKLDAAVFRPSNATWYVLQSSNNLFSPRQFGLPTDIPVPADYDGDGKTNVAVFRPSTGFWYTSIEPRTNYGGVQFGSSTDIPVPGDYDGDGKADVAVYRPSNGSWYLLRSTAGFTGVQFGAAEDKPIPNAYIK